MRRLSSALDPSLSTVELLCGGGLLFFVLYCFVFSFFLFFVLFFYKEEVHEEHSFLKCHGKVLITLESWALSKHPGPVGLSANERFPVDSCIPSWAQSVDTHCSCLFGRSTLSTKVSFWGPPPEPFTPHLLDTPDDTAKFLCVLRELSGTSKDVPLTNASGYDVIIFSKEISNR